LLSKLSSGILEIVLSGDNIVVNTEVRDEVILIMLVHVSLELLVGSSLGFEAFWEH